MKMIAFLWSVLLAAALHGTAIDGYGFEDPEMEARYKALIAQLRCPKCLNTNLSGSDAPIAVDLRRTVRRLLEEGKADDEILSFLNERYGDFVLYDPPFKASTALLWLLPAILLVVGGFVLRRTGQRREVVVLTEREQQRLDALGVRDAE